MQILYTYEESCITLHFLGDILCSALTNVYWNRSKNKLGCKNKSKISTIILHIDKKYSDILTHKKHK